MSEFNVCLIVKLKRTSISPNLAFLRIVDMVGVTRVLLPALSPNLNALADRWGKSAQDECLSRRLVFGEKVPRGALRVCQSLPLMLSSTQG